MILKSLLKGLDYEVIKGNEESKVQNIRYDNRKIEQGDAFNKLLRIIFLTP